MNLHIKRDYRKKLKTTKWFVFGDFILKICTENRKFNSTRSLTQICISLGHQICKENHAKHLLCLPVLNICTSGFRSSKGRNAALEAKEWSMQAFKASWFPSIVCTEPPASFASLCIQYNNSSTTKSWSPLSNTSPL